MRYAQNGSDIQLEKVIPTDEQVVQLYRLLSYRSHTISHQKSVSFSDHTYFVKTHPYRARFLISVADLYIGTVYLTNGNTIGVNIDDDYIGPLLGDVISKIKSSYVPLPSIASVRSGFFSINVPPSNKSMLSTLDKLGHKPLQITYYL